MVLKPTNQEFNGTANMDGKKDKKKKQTRERGDSPDWMSDDDQ